MKGTEHIRMCWKDHMRRTLIKNIILKLYPVWLVEFLPKNGVPISLHTSKLAEFS